MDTEKAIVTGHLLLTSTWSCSENMKPKANDACKSRGWDSNTHKKIPPPHGPTTGNRDQFVWLLPKKRKTGNFLSHVNSGKGSHRLFATLALVREHGSEVKFLAHIEVTTQLCVVALHGKPHHCPLLANEVVL